MEAIELSRNNWIFIILAVMLFSFVSCTKDDLPSEPDYSLETIQLDNASESPEHIRKDQ